MKIVKNTIIVTQDVIDGVVSLSEYVSLKVDPAWDFTTYFSIWINDVSLLGIKRVKNGTNIDVNFILTDAAADSFMAWFDGDKETTFPGLNLSPTSELIGTLTDPEVVSFFNDPVNEFSKVSFSTVLG
jgi:hypothetical protein